MTPITSGYTIPVLDHGFVRYIEHMGTDTRIVEAARVSYASASKGPDADKKLLSYLFRNKHTSPFEMCKVAFNVKMPIFVMRQWVRHRMQNLNEVSARYTELPNEFYVPTQWRKQDTANKQGSVVEDDWNQLFSSSVYGALTKNQQLTMETELAYKAAYSTYESLLSQGVAREMARMVLPVGIYTECYSCWDLKNLLHFFALRDDSHAQAEIQEYAKAMKQIVSQLFPWTMEVYEQSRLTK